MYNMAYFRANAPMAICRKAMTLKDFNFETVARGNKHEKNSFWILFLTSNDKLLRPG